MTRLSRSQKEIAKAAAEFARGEFDADLALTLEKEGGFPAAVHQKAADLGFIGLYLPETLSGGGLGLLEQCLVAEALCRRESAIGTALMTADEAALCLWPTADPAVQEKFLPAICDGTIRSAAALIEDERRPDPETIATTARQADDHWIVNGTKIHVAHGPAAGLLVALCRSDPEAPPEKAFSLIAIEADRPGISFGDAGRRLGGNTVSRSTVTFTDVRVPVPHTIGKPGKALPIVARHLAGRRILLAAQAVGIAAGALDRALAHVKTREQFDRKLATFEVTRHKIAEMAAAVETARAVTLDAAETFDTGAAADVAAAAAKLTACRAATAVADEAIQLFGGYGYMSESGVERFFRDAKALSVTDGTPARLKKEIADGVIGRLR